MKYITINDVCEMLSISRRTLERIRGIKNVLNSSSLNIRKTNHLDLLSLGEESLIFPEPDLFIGRSPRWERDKLISWLQENGSRLSV